MIKYRLIEKTEVKKKHLHKKSIRSRFFFRENDDICYKLQTHVDYMLKNNIAVIDLYLAKREINAPYFFCKHFAEVGEKSQGGCGNFCKGYEARNRKAGVCKHYGYTYIKTDRRFTLKLFKSF